MNVSEAKCMMLSTRRFSYTHIHIREMKKKKDENINIKVSCHDHISEYYGGGKN